MRTVPEPIRLAFERRPRMFVGENRLCARITVQPDWFLTEQFSESDGGLGKWPATKQPVRWFQDAANDQIEVELPRPLEVSRDESIDNQASTCQITIANTKMNARGAAPPAGTPPKQAGLPGYYWPLRGRSAEAQARWGQIPNEWANVLVQYALIRVYQGIEGPPGMTIEEAVDGGYLMLRFVGLLDEVQQSTNGKMVLKCRDMFALLVDQQMYVPLIPLDQYPMTRQRWTTAYVKANGQAIDITSSSTRDETPGDRRAVFSGSSGDAWYPEGSPGSYIGQGGYPIHGHVPGDAFDGNDQTWWLSIGNSRGDAEFAYDWLQVDVGEAVNSVYVQAWAGDYQMFVSVMEHGVWQGDATIPYDPSVLFGTQPYAVDTGAAIPYVAQFNVPWESASEYILPRMYQADKVRITFHNGTYTEWGPWHYRAGVREFRPRISAGGQTSETTVSTQHLLPIFISADVYGPSGFGYHTLTTFNQVDGLGDARTQSPATNPKPIDNGVGIAIRTTPTGLGYYILHTDGRVYAFGDAVHHGDPATDVRAPQIQAGGNTQANDLCLTDDGTGYWVGLANGKILGYGSVSADNLQCLVSGVNPIQYDQAILFSLDSRDGKLWALDTAGRVYQFHSAGDYGDAPYMLPTPGIPTEDAVCIRATTTGLGYWILTNIGHVYHFGDAPDNGGMSPLIVSDGNWRTGMWEIIRNPNSDDGYELLKGDGTVYPIGVCDYVPGPVSGQDEQREPGDYIDLVDIITDIVLWSGFWLKENLDPTATPGVFGTLETTGTWVNSVLNADFFDKKPPADVLKALAEITGYIMGARYDGGVYWRSPNIWQSGNYDEDSQHVDVIPEIDERVDLTTYGVNLPARPIRSPITIGSSDIDPHNPDATRHVEYTPPWGNLLRGLIRPLQWTRGEFSDETEMRIMAELIALRIWFQLRVAQSSAWMNPAVELDDQVRIIERQSSETYIHWVSAISDVMTFDISGQAGSWTMQLTTNWMGTADQWVIRAENPDDESSDDVLPASFPISKDLQAWLKARGDARVKVGRTPTIPFDTDATRVTSGADATPPVDDNAGPG